MNFNPIDLLVEEYCEYSQFHTHTIFFPHYFWHNFKYFNKISPDIIQVKFCDYFNSSIKYLPNHLVYIKFGRDFNCPVHHLKKFSQLKYLFFG